MLFITIVFNLSKHLCHAQISAHYFFYYSPSHWYILRIIKILILILVAPPLKTDFQFETFLSATSCLLSVSNFFIQSIMPSPIPKAFNLSSNLWFFFKATFVKHGLTFRNPWWNLFNNLCLTTKSTIWYLINRSNYLQITDVKLTGL